MADANAMDDQFALPMRELAKVLARHFAITDGLWDLTVEFKLGAATMGPSEELVLPTAVASVSRVGLKAAEKVGPLTIDAAELDARRS